MASPFGIVSINPVTAGLMTQVRNASAGGVGGAAAAIRQPAKSVSGPITTGGQAGGVLGANTVSNNNLPTNNTTNTANANIISQAQAARDTALGSARNSFGTLASGYQGGIDDLLQKIRTGQQGIDQSRENASLNKLRSLNDLKDSIRQGIQSGSVRLANGNALDSSAAEALAKGYGRFGTQQAGDVQNEYALANRDIDTNQSNLDYERESGLRNLENYKQQQAQQIGNSVYDRLAAIQDTAMSQGANGAVGDINAQKQQIINEALSQLQGLDQSLRGGVGGIQRLGQDQIDANAYNLLTAGGAALPANTFNYETAPGVGAVQNGAPIAQYPLVRRPDDY
jgi:hypothetical protein